MFADDMTLVASSWLSMKRMLQMLRQALARAGLTLHPSKCKLQTNNSEWDKRGLVEIEEGFSVEVLQDAEGMKVLGTMLHLDDATQHEIQHRISKAWRMFWGMKSILMNRKVSIARRMKLFSSSVTSCALWCNESWSPRTEDLKHLDVTRNGMLRRMLGSRRAPDEDYLEWIQRTTRKANGLATKAGDAKWSAAHRKSKWLWAGHVARREGETWLYSTSSWRDSQWQDVVNEMGHLRPLRPSKRRWIKWEDPIRRFCSSGGIRHWMNHAANRAQWASHAEVFAQFV